MARQPNKSRPVDAEALHREMQARVNEMLRGRVVPKSERDPTRLYAEGIGGIPDGYLDTLDDSQVSGIKRNYPGLYESLEAASNKLKKITQPQSPKQGTGTVPEEEKKEE